MSGATVDLKALIAEEDAEFVSLDELLTAMAMVGNGTYKDAARFLLRKLRSTDNHDRPPCCRLDTDRGIVTMTDPHDSGAWQCLRQAAENGKPAESEFGDDIPF